MSGKKKILMLLRNEFTNDHRVKKEAESLTNAGYHVTILAELQRHDIPQEEMVNSVKVVRIPVFSGFSKRLKQRGRKILQNEIDKKSAKASFLLAIKKNSIRRYFLSRRRDVIFFFAGLRFAKANHFDFVHAHDLDTLRLGRTISKRKRIPLIYDSHELWQSNNFVLQRNFFARKYLARLEKTLIKKTNAVITTTDSRANVLGSSFGIRMPVVVMNIPAYVEVCKTDILRKHIGVSDEEKIVIYQGGLSKNRGIYQLVEAICQLEKVRLVFLGAGDEEHNLKIFIRHHNLSDKVHILPMVPVDELLNYTASADVGAATYLNSCLSYYLCVPNKVFETMMAGIPLIMSDFPEYRKIAMQVDIGELVDPENPEEIAQAVQKLLNDRERLKKIKENCKLLTRTRYNWEMEEKKLLQLYAEIDTAK